MNGVLNIKRSVDLVNNTKNKTNNEIWSSKTTTSPTSPKSNIEHTTIKKENMNKINGDKDFNDIDIKHDKDERKVRIHTYGISES